MEPRRKPPRSGGAIELSPAITSHDDSRLTCDCRVQLDCDRPALPADLRRSLVFACLLRVLRDLRVFVTSRRSSLFPVTRR
jgi:hypothetical protein